MIAPTKDSTKPLRKLPTLRELEQIVHTGKRAFFAVGEALADIRKRELYRLEFDTFEEYCKAKFDFTTSRARQLVLSYQAVKNVESVTTVTPENERQARILASLETQQQQATVWCNAVETAPKRDDGTPIITATHVERTKDKFYPKEPRDVPPSEEEVNQAHQPLEAGPALSEAGEAEPGTIASAKEQIADLLLSLTEGREEWFKSAIREVTHEMADAI